MSGNLVDETIARAAAERRSALSEIESKRILEAIGIATQMAEPARSADEAAAAAERRGFPVVLKVLSPDVTHKSDIGGVALGLASKAEVREAFARIAANLSQKAPGARFEGVAVQGMAAAGLELLAGIARDPQFGPMVMVGLGGVFVEVLKDTAVRIAPVDKREARAMLAELRGAALLDGVRGSAAVDRDAIAELLVRISEFAARRAEIREMDLNPIAAYASGLSVLDARILLDHEVKDAAHGQLPAAEAAALQARRQENLRRALKPRTAVVIGDRGSRDFMWLRALDNFKGKRFSVQPDAKEGAAIEALGIRNFRTVSEIGEPIDYAIASVPRKIAPADACAMRRGRGRRHRILHRRFFRNRRSDRSGTRSGTEKDRFALGHRAGRPQLHGPVQPGTGAAQFREPARGRTGRRVLHLAERNACDQFLHAGSGTRNQGRHVGVDR